jgi:pyrrolidone-carboxylate peptidase
MTEQKIPRVLITGFGPFLDITTNPSYEIARRLPTILSTPTGAINVVVPDLPIPAKYHDIFTLTTSLIAEHKPDLVIHMGLAHGRTWFAVEKGAEREGYHEVPDMGRRVFTRAESKKMYGKELARLESSLDLESAVEAWKEDVKGVKLALGYAPGAAPGKGGETKAKGKKSKGKQKQESTGNSSTKMKGDSEQVDVRLSDDVGNYVCGFQYYVSLLEMQKSSGRRNSVFFHVPYLDSEEEVAVGIRVAEGLIRTLVGVWEGR